MHSILRAVLFLFSTSSALTSQPYLDIRNNPHAASTTFSEPTASTAVPTASGPTVHHGRDYLTFKTLTGFFLQDNPSTNASTFRYNETNFGLIHRSYPSDSGKDKGKGKGKDKDKHNQGHAADLTDWQRFDAYLTELNRHAGHDKEYKLLFIGRHSEGYHNAEESYVGTPAWNCYYAELPGNATVTWEDAALTSFGRAQAVVAHDFWRQEIEQQKIQTPQSYYTSPLDRCLSTAQLTFADLPLPKKYPFKPVVKELLREGISIHTCDRRSSRQYIESTYPDFAFEDTFQDTDHLWNGITAETKTAQDYRSKVVLDDIFSHDKSDIISITSHSGEAASLLRVLGHQPFSLVTGAIIPVFVEVEKVKGTPQPSTTQPWTTSAWCTNGPPKTSIAGGACVCSGGVTPVVASPSIMPRK